MAHVLRRTIAMAVTCWSVYPSFSWAGLVPSIGYLRKNISKNEKFLIKFFRPEMWFSTCLSIIPSYSHRQCHVSEQKTNTSDICLPLSMFFPFSYFHCFVPFSFEIDHVQYLDTHHSHVSSRFGREAFISCVNQGYLFSIIGSGWFRGNHSITQNLGFTETAKFLPSLPIFSEDIAMPRRLSFHIGIANEFPFRTF
jgi:hypothetical protein